MNKTGSKDLITWRRKGRQVKVEGLKFWSPDYFLPDAKIL
jgi:hypothetical protein